MIGDRNLGLNDLFEGDFRRDTDPRCMSQKCLGGAMYIGNGRGPPFMWGFGGRLPILLRKGMAYPKQQLKRHPAAYRSCCAEGEDGLNGRTG